jgi:radical SAM modification target selenobiotic family peptide
VICIYIPSCCCGQGSAHPATGGANICYYDLTIKYSLLLSIATIFCKTDRIHGRENVMEKDRFKSILAGMGIASLVAGMAVVPISAQGASG